MWKSAGAPNLSWIDRNRSTIAARRCGTSSSWPLYWWGISAAESHDTKTNDVMGSADIAVSNVPHPASKTRAERAVNMRVQNETNAAPAANGKGLSDTGSAAA